jgi:hypothetical protein
MDPHFKRLYYTRYADDFVIGVTGTFEEAKEFKEKCRSFMTNHLGLTLSEEKTRISHLSNEGIFFLGTAIKRRQPIEKPVRNGVRVTPRLSLHAPIEKLLEKLKGNGFFRMNAENNLKPTSLRRVINLDHRDIILYYNSVMGGLLNYYSFADNHKSLGSIVHGLKHSCALTLALKYKMRLRAKAFKKFGKLLKCPDSLTNLNIPPTFRRTQFFQTGNLRKVDEILQKRWNRKFSKSLLHMPCVVCGEKATEMHHLRKIRDLRKKAKTNWFYSQMQAINRKQVPLCTRHHALLHKNNFTEEERNLFSEGIKALK